MRGPRGRGSEARPFVGCSFCVAALGAGGGVLAVVEQEGVLGPPRQLDLVPRAEQPAPSGVLLEDLELLPPRQPDEVLRADAVEADIGHDATGDGVAGRVERLADLSDQDLLGTDAD